MLALHHRRLQAELRGADGRHVAAGSAADDDQIECSFCHGCLASPGVAAVTN